MTWRPWIVSAVLGGALVVNVVLAYMEDVPQPSTGREVERVDEVLRHLQYNPTSRRNNFKDMGMSDELAEATAKQIDRYARKKPQFEQMLADQAVTVAVAFCPGDMPQPYAALEFLVKEENERRDTIDPELLREFESQEWFAASNTQAIYSRFELTENRHADATLLGVSALLVQLEEDALDGRSPFSTGTFGTRGWAPLKKRAPRVHRMVIEYFSLMHFLTELANTRSGICA